MSWTALGTACELQFTCRDDGLAQAFASEAQRWVATFEGRYSRFRPDSLVSRINAGAGGGWIDVDGEMDQMLDLCAAVHGMSQGVLDVTALPLLRLWDYKAAQPRVPATGEIAAARRLVGWPKVERQPGRVRLPEAGMALDFGGWGKEYAVDAVAQIGRRHGLACLLVDFGHDVCAIGTAPGKPAWHVGLEDPAHPGRIWGSLGVSDRSVASSGDYLRHFTAHGRRYGHIVDPRTGEPVQNGCRQVTVLAPTCLQAGILSTTAFVLGPTEGLRLIQESYQADGCVLTETTRHQTRGFFHYVVTS
ncbi:MAG: FAD:protein FMN transferase [Verrucomicrobiota bacterium]